MPRYRLHYNDRCPDCVRLVGWNRRLDWLRRFERTTAPSALGIPEVGDIHITDHELGKIYSGIYAIEIVCKNIPAYWALALALKIPFVLRRMAKRKPGCNGASCAAK